MNKLLDNVQYVSTISLLCLLLSCSFNNKRCNVSLSEIDVARWNQMTINYLIDSARIDTTIFAFVGRKVRPPNAETYPYSYSIDQHTEYNDMAIVWCWLNKRTCILGTLDSLGLLCSDSLMIYEYYHFSDGEYTVSNGKKHYEIILTNEYGVKNIQRLKEFSTDEYGFYDNRSGVEPIKSFGVQTLIRNLGESKAEIIIEYVYIDSHY